MCSGEKGTYAIMFARLVIGDVEYFGDGGEGYPSDLSLDVSLWVKKGFPILYCDLVARPLLYCYVRLFRASG